MRMGLGLNLRRKGPSGPSYGPELVTNGTFTTDTTGWTPGAGATLSVNAGQLKVLSAGSGATASQTVLGMVVGHTYRFTGTMSPSQTDRATIGLSAGYSQTSYFAVTGGTVAYDFITSDVGVIIQLTAANEVAWADAGQFALFDNISIREVL